MVPFRVNDIICEIFKNYKKDCSILTTKKELKRTEKSNNNQLSCQKFLLVQNQVGLTNTIANLRANLRLSIFIKGNSKHIDTTKTDNLVI